MLEVALYCLVFKLNELNDDTQCESVGDKLRRYGLGMLVTVSLCLGAYLSSLPKVRLS